jgi:1-acyl-sn-glycerol-3-phosphate acyltransferase
LGAVRLPFFLSDFLAQRLADNLPKSYNRNVLTPFGKFLYAISRNLLLGSAKLFWRVKYEGLENVPRTGGLILASNHASHLDPPIVGIGIPRPVVFIAKQELFKVPFIGWWLRQLGQISVDRGGGGKQALRIAQRCLENGEVIIIFPEGTRSSTGRVVAGRSGVAVLAVKAGVPVIPVGIAGTYKAFRKGTKIPKLGKVIVRYGKPLYFEKSMDSGEVLSRNKLNEITAMIMVEIQKLLPQESRAKEGEVPVSHMMDDLNR